MTDEITAEEQRKYWEIFSGLSPTDGFLSGEQAVAVLSNSGLAEEQLEQVWDLADIDNDGRLDFEEFCVSMRLVFDVLSGKRSVLPKSLPDHLVPASKSHLLLANNAIEQGLDLERPESPDYGARAEGLKEGFDWYMSPADRRNYESIFAANVDRRGGVKFDRLQELYGSLSVPPGDIDRAWKLVNPKLQDSVGKDQLLAFLHCLNQRHQGYRIPRNVPASLRATFQKSEIDYNTSKYDRNGQLRGNASNTSEDKGKRFGGDYLDKLGVSRSGLDATKPLYDAGDIKDGDWEVVRLKRELADLDTQIARAEQSSNTKTLDSDRQTTQGVVRRELEQLLEFKKAELERLDVVPGRQGTGGESGLKSVRDDIEVFRNQIDMLTAHLDERQRFLASLEAQRANLAT
ncbi:endocytosis defective-related protein [Savitreella phatthalungensis]